MAASPTIYCLENVTDYFEFERMCHDLMAREGYSSIEPLGGFKDKGRDAVHVCRSGQTSIFAYSVREDWRAKLGEDASKIKKHGHTCNTLVFLSTAAFTAGERDEAILAIRRDYGWALELYGLERLRILLDAQYPEVKANHPSIFPPQFVALGQPEQVLAGRDLVAILSSPEDGPFVAWLARRLMAEGYQVWCDHLARVGVEAYQENFDETVRSRAFRVLGVMSRSALRNPEYVRQQMLAIGADSGELFIPLHREDIAPAQLDRITASLSPVPFVRDWATGLRRLVARLDAAGCPRLSAEEGRRVALSSLAGSDVLSGQTEQLFANCLEFEQVPEVVYRFSSSGTVDEQTVEGLSARWPFRRSGRGDFLSFDNPPKDVEKQLGLRAAGGSAWRHVDPIDGIAARDLIVELLRKSLIAKCVDRGLVFCPETLLYYFPPGLVARDRLSFTRPDARNGDRGH